MHNCIFSIYRGFGDFNFKSGHQSFKLQECQATSSIKCFLTIDGKGGTKQKQLTMFKQRQALLASLMKSISEVHSTYIPLARYPIAYIECPLCHEEGCIPHVRLEDISETENVYCFRSGGKIVPPQAYMMLLPTDTGE